MQAHYFDTLEEMITDAYSKIDPLLKPLPDNLTPGRWECCYQVPEV